MTVPILDRSRSPAALNEIALHVAGGRVELRASPNEPGARDPGGAAQDVAE